MPNKELILATFGSELRRLREARGLTQDALADAAGLSRRFVVSLEAGTANPSLLRLLALSHALGVTPGRLTDSLLEALESNSPTRCS